MPGRATDEDGDCAVFFLDGDGRVASWSEPAARFHGIPAEEALGHRYECLSAGGDADVACALGAAASKGEHHSESWFVARDGRRFRGRLHVAALPGHGGFACVLRDLTGERHALDELRGALRAKNELLTVVAHDMRSPLHSIRLGSSHLERLLGRGEASARRKAAAISAQAERLVRIVGDLLDAGCIEAGKLAVSPRAVRARDLVASTVADLAPVAEERRIALLAAELPGKARVLCDRGRIDQVFENLVGNALKFTSEGGKVVLGAQPDGKEVVFSVRDTGPGIPPAELPRIFECWYKGGAQGRCGSGLGLFIARGIVEAHRGRLWAESQRGVGSTFRFTLPAA